MDKKSYYETYKIHLLARYIVSLISIIQLIYSTHNVGNIYTEASFKKSFEVFSFIYV